MGGVLHGTPPDDDDEDEEPEEKKPKWAAPGRRKRPQRPRLVSVQKTAERNIQLWREASVRERVPVPVGEKEPMLWDPNSRLLRRVCQG